MNVERTSLERGDVNYGANSWHEEEEIDLRKYIDALVRWWREIIVVTGAMILLVIVVVEGLQFLLAPKYEATASVAIVRTFSDVSLDPRFKTQTDDTANAQTNTSSSSRRSALLSLASSGSIAQKVIDQIGDKLNNKEKIAANLIDQVTAELAAGGRSGGESDLLNITVVSDSPEKATLIANTWSQIYVQAVNAIYGQVPDDLLTSIKTEQTTAQTGYEKSQTDLETFVADNHIDTLNRQITETQNVIDNLQRGKADALAQLVNNVVGARSQVMREYLTAQANSQVVAYKKEQDGRQALITAYLNAINNAQVDVFQQQSDQDAKLLRSYYNTWQQSVQALDDANGLKAQVEKGGQGAVRSSGLALQLLKLQVFTQIFSNDTQPLHPNRIENGQLVQNPVQQTDENNVRLQLQFGDNTPALTQEEMLGDLNSLITVLDTRRKTLEAQIAKLSEQLLAGSNYSALGKTIPLDSKLVQAVQAQYEKLGQPSWSSPLTSTLALLAATTVSPTLSQTLPASQALDQLGEQWAKELLQLKGLGDLPTSKAVDGSVAQTISQLETQKLALKSQLEAERARQLRLTHERDLNWDTLKTLSSKVAELNLARAANSSEVRLAAPAVPPVDPLKRVSLILAIVAAGVIGLLVGIVMTLLSEYLGKEPFLRRRPLAPKATAAGA